MGNFTSNQLITKKNNIDYGLTAPMLNNKLEPILSNESQNNRENNEGDNLIPKGMLTKGQKKKLEDIIIDHKELLPEGFSSLEELKNTYLHQKEKKKQLADELCEWELTLTYEGKIKSIVVTYDDQYLISTIDKGLILIFELRSRRIIYYIKDEDGRTINSVAVTEDSENFVAAIKTDIKLFNIKQQSEIFTITNAHNAVILSLLVAKNFIITGADDGSIKVFDITTQQEVYHFANIHQDSIYSMALLNDYNTFISASGDRSIKIFDLKEKKQIHHFPEIHKGVITKVVVSYDNKYLITGSVDHSVKIINLETKEELCHFRDLHEDEVTALAVSKDNKCVYTGSTKSIKILDLENKQEMSGLPHFDLEFITSLALSNDGKHLYAGFENLRIIIYDLQTQQREYESFREGLIRAIAISNDNKYIVVGSKDGCVKMFDFTKKDQKPKFFSYDSLDKDTILSLTISSRDKYLVAKCLLSVRVFDFESRKEIYVFKHQEYCSMPNTISSDERFILIGDGSSIKVFDIEKHEEVRKIDFETHVSCFDLSQDIKYLAIGFDDSSIKAIDFATNCEVFYYKNTNGVSVQKVMISQDNKYILSGYTNYLISVFNLQKKDLVSNIHLKNSISSFHVTNDNKHIIVSLRYEDTIKVWDWESGQEIHSYRNVYRGEILPTALSKDNQYYVLMSKDKTLKVMKAKRKEDYCLVEDPKYNFNYIYISEEAGCLVFIVNRGEIKLFDLKTKQEIYSGPLDIYSLNSFGIQRNCPYLVFKDDSHIKIFNLKTQKEENFVEDLRADYINLISVSDDGKFIATSEFRKSIKLYDFEKKTKKWELLMPKGVSSIAICNKKQCVITGDEDGNLQLYDLHTSQKVHCFEEVHNSNFSAISALTLTNNNKYILTGSITGSIKIFDMESKQETHSFESIFSAGTIRSITISNDDRFIIAVSENLLKILDMHTGMEVTNMPIPEEVMKVAISSDNKEIFAGKSILPTYLSGVNELSYISSKIPLASLYTGYDDFLTLQWPKDTETQKRFLLYYQDMYIFPHSWTVLHLLSIFNPSSISGFPEYSQYRVPFLLDSYCKTPLHYLIAQRNRDYSIINIVLKYIINYLEDKDKIKAYEYQKICSSLSSCFFFMISRVPPSLIAKFLNLCYPKTYPQHSQKLPSFGVSTHKYIYNQMPVIEASNLTELYEEGDERINFHTNLIVLDYDPRSDDMFTATHLLSEVQEEIIFKRPLIENLINHLWESTSKTMYITAIAFSALMILFSLYIALEKQTFYLEISIIVLTILFFSSEVIQVLTVKEEYLRDPWNCIDFIQLSLLLTFMFIKLFEDQEITGEAWIVSVIIITGYLRWISYLRLFTTTRILIEIILTVFYDMLGFITVIASILIGFSLIFLEFSRSQPNPQEYGYHFYNTFKLLFGNYDDTDYSLSQIVLVSFLLCVLNVVLLNLLIAIIGDSYGKVQEMKNLIDGKTRLGMIEEAMILMRRIKPKKTVEKRYLIYRLPALAEEAEGEYRELEARIYTLERNLSQKVYEEQENMRNEMKLMKNELKQNIEEQVSKVKNEIKDDIQGLKQLINLVLANLGESTKPIQQAS